MFNYGISIMVSIGSQPLPTNVLLAPLSGCSDLAFRLIARECGAQFCFFEMVDAHSLVAPNPHKFDLLQTIPDDAPIAAQLVGPEPDIMRDAAQILLNQVAVTFLDINSACPVKKVVKKGAGAALLNSPEILGQIIRTLATSVSVPITAKLRIGFNQADEAALIRLAQICEANGAAALFVHGRTRAQGYSGEVNYAAIRMVKQAVRIPVFGSGNVFTPQLARHMLTETDCDGVLAARGVFGNPWLLRDIEHYLQQGVLPEPPGMAVRKQIALRHLAYLEQYKARTPRGKVGVMRKITLWYLKGFSGASHLRGQVSALPNYEALVQFVETHLAKEGL